MCQDITVQSSSDVCMVFLHLRIGITFLCKPMQLSGYLPVNLRNSSAVRMELLYALLAIIERTHNPEVIHMYRNIGIITIYEVCRK